MSIAAVPAYLGKDFKDASPGMRFGMYLPIWKPRWEKNKEPNWAGITDIQNVKKLMASLIERQRKIADRENGLLLLPAQSIAPFTTGLGNEHPLENGFSFLWPYGIPYLPGSGVKGVLRQAARELADGCWGETHGWDEALNIEIGNSRKEKVRLTNWSDLLFGLESKDGEKEHFRGLLTFWDVIPEIKGNKLMVEIMTPHQKHYYQDGQQPHDSGQPTPISFLTVPPGSSFNFHVQCDTARFASIAPGLTKDDRWQPLIEAAFRHAFDWLGFGAKTAVGYGAMQVDEAALEAHREAAIKAQKEAELEAELAEASAGLPEDAAWVVQQRIGNAWADNTAFLDSVEEFLKNRDSLSGDALERLMEEMTQRWKGIMENPDAVKGKKQNPKFKERPRKLANLLLGWKRS